MTPTTAASDRARALSVVSAVAREPTGRRCQDEYQPDLQDIGRGGLNARRLARPFASGYPA